jgi:hypothetical protein
VRFSDIDLLAIGHEIVMVGAVYRGGDEAFVAWFPDEQREPDYPLENVEMTVDDWQALLKQADHLERGAEVTEQDGTVRKAILRKSQRQIDQWVSWNVFRRDRYACRYCGRNDCPLTVDHLVLWEDRGPSTEENLVSACKKCNKTRGLMPYGKWLHFQYYMRVSAGLTPAQRAANDALEHTLASIPRVERQRSR